MTSQKNLLAILFVLIILGVVSTYIFKDLRKSTVNNLQPPVEEVETAPILLGDGISGDYKINVLPNEEPKNPSASAKIPDLSLPVTNYSRLDEAAFKAISQNISKIVLELKNEPNNELGWLNLAVYRKMLGDYAGAVQLLDYVVISWPSDYAPYNNLADLYQFYIKNYPLAEKNWLKVIELKPDYLQAYINLYDLYKDLYTEKQAKRLPILQQGLANNPKSIDLMVYIARYYRLAGDNAQARVYNDKAITEANNLGKGAVLDSLSKEAEGSI